MNGQTLVKGPSGGTTPVIWYIYIYTHQTTPIMWNIIIHWEYVTLGGMGVKC